MTSCEGNAGLKRLDSKKNERPAAAPRNAAPVGAAAFPVSAIALAVALFTAAPQMAHAFNECGAEVAGADTINCSNANYPGSINYNNLIDSFTLNLNNPATTVGGTIGLRLQALTGTTHADLVINAASFGSITTTTNSAVLISNGRATGSSTFTMDAGSLNSNGGNPTVQMSSNGDSHFTLNGGLIRNASGYAVFVSGSKAGNVTAAINGGSIESGTGNAVRVGNPFTGGTGFSEIRMSGGKVVAGGGAGLWVESAGSGQARVAMTGGTVSATGKNGDGILATSKNSTYVVEVTDGSIVSGGSGFGAAIHTAGAGGGIVNIGEGATITAGASGVALRDGDLNRDGIDEIGGNTTITTAGTLTGAVLLGGGTDTLNIAGGAIAGNLTGDGADALNFNLGTNSFTHGAAFAITGMNSVTMNSGTAQIDSTISGNTQLTVNGGTMVLTGANSYTGSTTIGGGTLALAGAGSVATSSQVIADGTFDISGVSAAGTSVQRLSGSGAVMLGGKALTLTAAADTFSGAIAGTGSLALAGGAQVLTGTNTYTGGTAISATSTLQLGDGGTSGSIVGNVVNDGTFVFNRANRLDLGGDISGSGGIRQVGTGMTNLTGNSAAFAGTTTVEAGTLAVNGALGGAMSVLATGRLQGSGTVGGSATVNGTVAPGNSIGTLSINGNFTQFAGSTYQVEVDPASTASDLLRVGGSASIASGAQLNVVRAGSGSFGIGTRYTVLSADGGVIGTYNLTGDTESAFVRVIDTYDANHVYLLAQKTRSFTEPATTPNQVAVGGALETLPGSNPLSTAVAWLPNDFAARDALNQLSADIHASSKTAALEDSRFVREAAIDRLRSAACAPGSAASGAAQKPMRAGTGCTPEDSQARAGWAQVFGSWGRIDSDGNAAKLKRDIGGFFVGADTGIAAGWRVGALGGYSRASADTSARNSSSKTESYHLGVYGGTQWGATGATALRLGVSHSWNKTDTSRSVAFAGFSGSLAGKYDSSTTQAFGELGHRIDLGAATLEPFAGLAHVRLRSDAFVEQGGLAALYGYGGRTDATFSTIGVRASMQASESIRLRGTLGWRHAFGGATPTSTHAFAGSVPFTLSGVPLAKDVAVLEAGIETQLRPNLALNASYSGQFGDRLQDHGFKVNLNWSF
ncbi:autotransporter outer membrane beta-barrel domain-containing protein [Variovorax sp. CCNWLW235]|uniref:autotransporter outer membrane beta-barrel domain-containing protein n=1 Tax=Variovorax sp. CCNWLW235 TaxID=3127463 RepID=UPI003077F3C3